jgi:hypothetical protein
MARRTKPRRGVLLLVVLSILVLFVLTSLTFIVVAGHYHRGAISASPLETTGDEPSSLLDRAMYELVRDTTNAQSSIGRHSLLNDLYGNDGFVGRILGPAGDTNTSGQIVQFRLIVEAGLRQSPPQARPADYYNGAVMTMTSGRARGLSARIIRSRAIVGDGSPNGSFSGTIFAEAFLSDQNEFILPENGDRFVVNGVPFNGAGFGYNPNTGRLDLGNPLRIALQPHFKAHTTSTPFELGGADESYDAVDVQNLFLAKVPTTAGDPIIPSFHQPALIRYWMEQGLAQLKNRFGDPVPPDVLREFLRPFVLRPTPLDHPFFTGSNPAFGIAANDTATLVQILLQGPWDVDNDSDGVPDSVWLDLGFPTSATGDGRLFRPLFAILCTDLDGRLNLNVHGSLAQIGLLQSITRPGADSISINGVAVRPPRGLGYGPAEVNFADVFGPSFGPAAYENVLRNRYADPAGRLETSTAAVPGFVAGERLGVLKVADVPTDYEAPARAPVGNALPEMSAYGSPPDLHGRGAVLLDFAGQPQFIAMGQPDETINNPYELDVINRSGSDSIYGVGDLERLLRAGDADAPLLPNRLRRVAWGAFAFAKAQQDGRLVTTHSFHLPVPNIQLPAYLRQSLAGQAGTSAGNGAQPPLADVLLASQGGLSSSATVVSWMYARLLANRVPEATIPDQLRLMLPFEIRHGGKMDINRPWADTLDEFGRGDINGDGQVDGERAVQLAFNTVLNRTGQSLVSDYRNDDESRLARYAVTRQIYARHLYCLAMMLLAPDYVDPTVDTNVTPQQAVELTARRMAQWAINAVDFRDADAIMTPFEFDVNPMNGWQLDIDGDPATFEGGERRIVWGCEYPHLLLTETMAFHDTRLKDSDWDTGSGKRRDEDGDGTSNPAPPDEEDEDLDQFRIPEGSFFAELYCTFDANNRHPQGTTRIPPRELYQYDSTDGLWKLDVGRVPLEQRRDRAIYPVWRLAISRPHSPGESVFAKLQARPDTTTLQPQAMDYFAPQEIVNIDRIVWFTSVRPAATTFERERIFWNWLNMPTGVAGKGYAVVGPRTKTFLGSSQANSPSGSQLTNRLIELDAAVPGAPGGNAVRTLPNYPQIGLDVKKAIGIVAAMDPPAEWTNNLRGRSIGVNVSEPLATGPNYYREPRHRITNPGPYPVIDAYAIKGETAEKMPDEPFDGQPNRPLADLNLAEGTVQNFRTVFLQRLANPLRPWNPAPGHPGHQAELPVNPYLTVDWMPVDLTVFNGEERRPANWNGPDWQWPGGRIDPDIRFSTRERGVTGRQIPDVFSWSITQLQNTNPVVRTDFFEHNMTHTLGFLNSTYGLPRAAGNAPYYAGDPRLPFPWLTWNDRPYANHFELMLVPASSPSRLGLEFTTETRQDPYRGNTVDNLRAPFEHLLNFFHSSRTPRESPNLCQLFDMVEVPSRFVGTEQWYNPMFFARQANEFNTLNRPIFTFRPPFNKLSRFRDPGRVNINTINDIRVWQAIAHGFPRESSPAFWDNLVRSRRGYNLGEEGRFPTEIANPFRSSLGADLQFELVGLDKPAVEATLLRSDPDNADVPLFEYDSRQVHDDTGRNPYFRYQFLRRLANVVTNHSNVFAVWITVGYFEVDPQTGQLGQELNSDTGDVKRHRSFYIIDRSIPVAFEPGENHNVDRAVLLRRFIE